MNGHPDAVTTGDPAPIAAVIAGLLRTLPGPTSDPTASADTVGAWLTAKADLLERIATATADPDLAAYAATCAARARAVTAHLTHDPHRCPEGATS